MYCQAVCFVWEVNITVYNYIQLFKISAENYELYGKKRKNVLYFRIFFLDIETIFFLGLSKNLYQIFSWRIFSWKKS